MLENVYNLYKVIQPNKAYVSYYLIHLPLSLMYKNHGHDDF